MAGSITAYLDNIPVARNIASDQMLAGRHVIVAIPGGNPKDACVIAVWAGAAGGGGGGSFLALTDTPSSYSGQAGKSPVVNAAQSVLEFGQRATVSTANKTTYVDKAATGSGDGTSWADAFTTIQAAVDSLPNVILHDYVVKVRKGSTPYRETVYLNSAPANHPSHIIKGTLTIEAEYYWYADCDAHAVAGEIYDADADFSHVEVGDKVFILDLNGPNGRPQGYEVCTVDDISQVASHIVGTNGTKSPTTNWKYVIVKTEISGSDDGTDAGTVRDNCFKLYEIQGVVIKGFLMTYSDSYALRVDSHSAMKFHGCILLDCDDSLYIETQSSCRGDYIYSHVEFESWGNGTNNSYLQISYGVFDGASGGAAGHRLLHATGAGLTSCNYCYFDTSPLAVFAYIVSGFELRYCTISANSSIGIQITHNAVARLNTVTNNATTPTVPATSSDGAYIG